MSDGIRILECKEYFLSHHNDYYKDKIEEKEGSEAKVKGERFCMEWTFQVLIPTINDDC